MKKIVLQENEYEIIKNYKQAFKEEDIIEKYTEYFQEYDYILGDYSYDKLRLKGFYRKDNKNCKDYNNYEKVDEYLKKFCSYECRYYILQKKEKNI